MPNQALKLGTRGSRLALIQTDMVRQALAERWDLPAIEFVTFTTAGDRDRRRSIEEIGGRGIFTDELDEALLSGAIDIAVHSVKDLPAIIDRRLNLAGMLEREDPREAFVSGRYARLRDVPTGAVFGSASVRRQTLLRRLRADARFALLRGNVEERVAALGDGRLDGTILAVAGLKRLGLTHHIGEVLDPNQLMPDPGQGAIGMVCRADDARTRFFLAGISHGLTRSAVAAERAFLAAAGAHAIVGALAQIDGDQLVLRGVAMRDDPASDRADQVAGDPRAPERLGLALARRLLVHRQAAERRQ